MLRATTQTRHEAPGVCEYRSFNKGVSFSRIHKKRAKQSGDKWRWGFWHGHTCTCVGKLSNGVTLHCMAMTNCKMTCRLAGQEKHGRFLTLKLTHSLAFLPAVLPQYPVLFSRYFFFSKVQGAFFVYSSTHFPGTVRKEEPEESVCLCRRIRIACQDISLSSINEHNTTLQEFGIKKKDPLSKTKRGHVIIGYPPGVIGTIYQKLFCEGYFYGFCFIRD